MVFNREKQRHFLNGILSPTQLRDKLPFTVCQLSPRGWAYYTSPYTNFFLLQLLPPLFHQPFCDLSQNYFSLLQLNEAQGCNRFQLKNNSKLQLFLMATKLHPKNSKTMLIACDFIKLSYVVIRKSLDTDLSIAD